MPDIRRALSVFGHDYMLDYPPHGVLPTGEGMRGGCLFACLIWSSVCLAGPAESITAFRQAHGLSAVKIDPSLTRLAREQAEAMAAARKMDHNVRASFMSRMSSYPADRAAENIAMGHATFEPTLEQWKNSPGHRANLLLRDASRIGIASAGSGQDTYWALILAADPKARKPQRVPPGSIAVHEFKVQLPWPLSLLGQ